MCPCLCACAGGGRGASRPAHFQGMVVTPHASRGRQQVTLFSIHPGGGRRFGVTPRARSRTVLAPCRGEVVTLPAIDPGRVAVGVHASRQAKERPGMRDHLKEEEDLSEEEQPQQQQQQPLPRQAAPQV